ncbi:MAG: hypothetical protein A3K18_17545 [Lentisphaerae bacterium RIFOXYA12_64_32]|nr:MAG: hypothetical protein A3K18_17545 [Lentisphaerae bacterium RIFOXYA12_64_32]
MKTWGWIQRAIVATGVVCVLGMVGTPRVHGADSLANVVPDNTALFVEIPDIGKLRQALRDSEFGKSATTAPILQSVWTLIDAAEGLATQYLGDMNASELEAMLPSQWALCVQDLPDSAGDFDQPPVLFMGRLTGDGKALEELWSTRLFPRLKTLMSDAKIETADEGGTVAYRFQKPGESVLEIAFAHGMMLAGSTSGVAGFISGGAKPQAALAQKDSYKAAVEQFLPNALVTAYADVAPVIKRQLADLPEKSKQRRDMWVTGLESCQGVSSSAAPLGGRFQERVFVNLGENAQPGLLGMVNTREPMSVKSAALIPKNYVFHGAMSITSGKELWTNIRDLVVAVQGQAANAQIDQGLEFIRTQLQVDLEKDIMGQLAAETFMAVAPINLQELVASKRRPNLRDFDILVGLEVKDPKAARETLRFIVESPFMTVQGVSLAVQNFQDTDLHIVSAPNLPGGSRAYAFVGSFLVIARDAESLKAVIKAQASGENLAATPRFASAPAPFSGPVVFSEYVNLSGVLAEVVSGLIRANQPKLEPFVAAIASVMAQTGEIRVVGRSSPRGIVTDGDLAIPLGSALMGAAAGDYFGKPIVARKAKRAEERMKEVAGALRRYYQRNQAPPDTLVQLVPAYIEELPGDPFAGGAEFGYGISTGGSGWILVSVGPDGKRDVDLNEFSEEKWKAVEEAKDPAALEEARRLIYQFRPKQFADERGYDDEGDIINVGRWQ